MRMRLVNIPTDAGFSSMNLAQSVVIVAYEWKLSAFGRHARGLRVQTGDGGNAGPLGTAL